MDSGSYETCEGAILGNDSNLDFEDEINDVFGTTGEWSEYAKVEGLSGTDGALTLDDTNGSITGDFALSGVSGDVVIVAKGAGCFSAYYFTGVSDPTTGSYDMDLAGVRTNQPGNPSTTIACSDEYGNVAGISHLTVYTVAAIPLPAAGLMLLLGLGGLAAVRRRKAAS